MKGEHGRGLIDVSTAHSQGSESKDGLTRAIIDCFVDALLNTFSSFTPLISSSIRPSSRAAFTRANSFLLSRARFFFEDVGSLVAAAASVVLFASCSNRL